MPIARAVGSLCFTAEKNDKMNQEDGVGVMRAERFLAPTELGGGTTFAASHWGMCGKTFLVLYKGGL